MPFLDLATGARLFYLDENPAAPQAVLLLHGLGANGNSWQLQTPALIGAGFRVIAPDTPGFGQSTYPGDGTSILKLTSPIAELLGRLQLGPTHVVGISMGGTQALQLALDWPECVAKLVLVNTFAHLDLSKAISWPYFLLRFILVHTLGLEAQGKAVARRIFPHADQEILRQMLIDQIMQADPHGYRAAMRALARFNVSPRLHEIMSPSLVITGAQDTTVPIRDQDALVHGIANARQVIIPGAGHAVSVDKPEEFNHNLLEFLAS
jgi:3-oxoadipate enol-lactonase